MKRFKENQASASNPGAKAVTSNSGMKAVTSNPAAKAVTSTSGRSTAAAKAVTDPAPSQVTVNSEPAPKKKKGCFGMVILMFGVALAGVYSSMNWIW
jgi:hypothetical protein